MCVGFAVVCMWAVVVINQSLAPAHQLHLRSAALLLASFCVSECPSPPQEKSALRDALLGVYMWWQGSSTKHAPVPNSCSPASAYLCVPVPVCA
eukprot:1150630-Pelagomonas_calceolata.AAC.3